jgi:hypothetical protein
MSTRGRPTLYKAENADLARKFCMLGATNEDLAKCFEVSRSTIDHWIDTISEFAEAIRLGRDLADADVIQTLYSRAMGFTKEIKKHVLYRGELREIPLTLYYPPDIHACFFWMRNRRRRDWLEKGRARQDDVPTVSELEAASERVRLGSTKAANGDGDDDDADDDE